jgi:hypothetical protein
MKARKKKPQETREQIRDRRRAWVISALADKLGGSGWDDERLLKLLEGWYSEEEYESLGSDGIADALLEQSYDPRPILQHYDPSYEYYG